MFCHSKARDIQSRRSLNYEKYKISRNSYHVSTPELGQRKYFSSVFNIYFRKEQDEERDEEANAIPKALREKADQPEKMRNETIKRSSMIVMFSKREQFI
jgi:hypothetical protein